MESEKYFNPESRKESAVDLSVLTFDFYADDQIKNHYDQKLLEVEDKDKWLEENKESLVQNKTKILKAVEDGLIPDSRPETI